MARVKKRWRRLPPGLVKAGMYAIVNGIGRTLRIETRGFEAAPERTIYCGWHGLSFPFATHFRGRGWWVIISKSRDGELQNAIFERLGFQIARGSTGRGGERAAVRTIKALRAGGVMAMTPDGPRGPSGVVQNGVLLIAQKSGSQLVPVGVGVSSRWVIERSWDRFVIPKPFARVLMVAGEGLPVPEGADLEPVRVRLQEAIVSLQASVDREMAG